MFMRTTRALRAVTLIILICGLSGCGYQLVEDSDFAILQKAKGGDYELIKKKELTELRRQADLGKSIGRYQIYRSGFRTWRLDSSTGMTCILLTSEDDWKKPNTAAQGCEGAN